MQVYADVLTQTTSRAIQSAKVRTGRDCGAHEEGMARKAALAWVSTFDRAAQFQALACSLG
jgi:hypothetical protein